MANVLPVKPIRAGATVTGLGEFQPGDTLDPSVLPGGSVTAHESALDPHPQYVTAGDVASASPVQSVAGKTGTVTLVKSDVGLGNVDNTPDADKPVSVAQALADTAIQAAAASDATTKANAAQAAAIEASAPAAHTHSYTDLTDVPALGTLGTAAALDAPASGNASTTEVVMGNDTRLSDARPASDVSAWAKAATKPSYSATEVGAAESTHTHTQYQEVLVSSTNIKSINGESVLGYGNLVIESGSSTTASIPSVEYDARSTLRTLTPSQDDLAIIDGLGLFRFVSGSDEPDDDESCFATTTGKWLLEAAHWDLIDCWQAPDRAASDEYDSSFASKILTGSATCAVTTLAAITSVTFTGTVIGASVGDHVVLAPPAALGSTTAHTGRLSCYGYVSEPNVVTVVLTNASAESATLNTAVQTAWPITVIKS